MTRSILITGATGLVGAEVLPRLLRRDREVHVWALVRNPARWEQLAARLGAAAERVSPVVGDLTLPGLGLSRADRLALRRSVGAVVHAAADTCFSRSLPAARAVNTEGTLRLLELASEWPPGHRVVYVSTAFVAGRLTGRIGEAETPSHRGWVNAYERSKHEAEALVRASGLPWVVLRPSTIVWDGGTGGITQLNSVHRALGLFHAGLAALLPGQEDTPVDVVTTDYVADAVAELALREDALGGTYHLCAGEGALPLGDLLDRCIAVWSSAPEWRARAIARPALTDLETYRLFERTVEETGDARLRRITRSLSHFVPQLSLPKRFETAAAERALGHTAPPVRLWWSRMLEDLTTRRRGPTARRAA